jgi:hypothetical protein
MGLASLKSTVMSARDIHDIVVYSSDRRPALVVEVKAAKETSPERASAIRNNLLQRDPLLSESFFLLAYNTSLFLWDKKASADAKPRTAAVKDVLRDYGGASADRDEGPSPESLMTMMYFWLDDLAVGIRKPKETSEADQLLVRNGVYECIRHGRVEREARG